MIEVWVRVVAMVALSLVLVVGCVNLWGSVSKLLSWQVVDWMGVGIRCQRSDIRRRLWRVLVVDVLVMIVGFTGVVALLI